MITYFLAFFLFQGYIRTADFLLKREGGLRIAGKHQTASSYPIKAAASFSRAIQLCWKLFPAMCIQLFCWGGGKLRINIFLIDTSLSA